MRDDSLDYHALTAAPRDVFDARDELEKLGADVIVPIEVKMRRKNRHNKAKVPHEYPAFGGYIIAGVKPLTQPWRVIETKVSAVTFNGEPARIFRKSEIDRARDIKPTIDALSTHKAFQEGGKARIASGPLEGYTVDVGKIRGKFAWVSLQHAVMGKAEVKVTLDLLEAA